MANIEFKGESFLATTFAKGGRLPDVPAFADPFLVVAGKDAAAAVSSADEVPLFFGVSKRLLGAAKIDLESGVKEDFAKRFHAAITQYGLNPGEIEVYMGPCLTFSHTHVERKLIEELMDRGYRAACKRTDGVDFLDLPLLILMQLRREGVPMKNIHIGDYDTYENPELLRSKLRGDEGENITIAKLLA